MENHHDPSRREFLKSAAAAGVAVSIIPVQLLGRGDEKAAIDSADSAAGWSGKPGQARYRIEGELKVTGAKTFARDFRPRDFVSRGWPQSRDHYALILRAASVSRPFLGVETNTLAESLLPKRLVTAETLEADGISLLSSSFFSQDLFLKAGQAAPFYGMPVAMLIYDDYWAYKDVQTYLGARGTNPILRFGDERPVESDPYVYLDHPTQIIRYVDVDGEAFSQAKDGRTKPSGTRPADVKARLYNARIENELKSSDWVILQREFETQSVDPCFLEPECGLGWYDGEGKLELVLASQSPDGDAKSVASLCTSSGCKKPVDSVTYYSCSPGGAFGGRDHSMFPFYLTLASVYADGPVRLAYDRFEQFQSGLKRPATRQNWHIGFDRSTKKIQAFSADIVMDGGGRMNFSPYVAALSAFSATGSYRTPKHAIQAHSIHSFAVTSGSMRGFGVPPAYWGIESLMDEAASELGMDPIELRRSNVLMKGERNAAGGIIQQDLKLDEICARALKHPLWRERFETKKAQPRHRGRAGPRHR